MQARVTPAICRARRRSPQGLISVGTLAILADGPLGCAVHTALPARTGYATSEMSLFPFRRFTS